MFYRMGPDLNSCKETNIGKQTYNIMNFKDLNWKDNLFPAII